MATGTAVAESVTGSAELTPEAVLILGGLGLGGAASGEASVVVPEETPFNSAV